MTSHYTFKKLLQTTKEWNCNNAFSHSKANEQKLKEENYTTKFHDIKTNRNGKNKFATGIGPICSLFTLDPATKWVLSCVCTPSLSPSSLH